LLTLILSVAIANAHPADSVLQRTSVEIQPTTITIRVDLLGGSESYRALQFELDQRGDPAISAAELDTWLRRSWIPAMGIEIDGEPVLLNSANTVASFDGPPEMVFLVQPLVVSVSLPAPGDGEEHTLLIRNEYSLLHTEYQLEMLTGPGVQAEQASNAGMGMAIRFRTDPAIAAGPATQASFSVVTASGEDSWLDQVRDQWIWLAMAGMVGAVGLWLGLARRRDQTVARSVSTVRQIQASRKKPVAVKTIEAPDE
jgi:hypothetical protein